MENKNEPAYPFIAPSVIDKEVTARYNGLTKRELIAAMIAQGMVSNNNLNPYNWKKDIVERVMEITDELLTQLNKTL